MADQGETGARLRRMISVCFELRLFAILVVVVQIAGCSGTPTLPSEDQSLIFSQPITIVKDAAVDALVVTGFDVEESSATYVQGSRPRKVGFFVGSGGETIGVWLESLDEGRTRVRVATGKSFVGYVGQKTWDNAVLAEIGNTLRNEK